MALPRPVAWLLERRLPTGLHDMVLGDLEERWTADRSVSRVAAWRTLLRLAASVLWHAALEARRTRHLTSHHSKGDPMLSAALHDLRFTWRLARRQPWLSAAAIATLGLGIGATTAIFAVIQAWILAPLPYREPGRLAMVWETIPSASIFENTPAPASLAAWTTGTRAFESLAAWTAGTANLTGLGEPARLATGVVSRDLLPLLGIEPVHGRNFTAEEAVPNGPPAVLLTHATWLTRFGGRPDAVGQRITLSGVETTVVGVLPETARLLDLTTDVWVPLRMTAAEMTNENRILWVMGRLAPGATLGAAQAEADGVMRGRTEGQLGARVVPLQEQVLGPLGRDLPIMFGATAFVLLIACANVASLTLARITGRRQELVVRTALGAARGRIVRQILTESVGLGAAGAVVGLLLAAWAIRAVVVLAPEADRMPEVSVSSPWIFAFAFAAATLTAMLFGILPAWRSGGLQVATAMREGTPSVMGGRQRLLRAVVVVEVALALALLAGAGLIVRSYYRLSNVSLGFETKGVVAFELPRSASVSDTQALNFSNTLLHSITEIPGVQAAGMIQALPLRSSAMGAGFRIADRTGDGSSVLAYWRITTPDYFETLSIPLVRGRAFDERDREGAELTAIVTESFAQRAWPGEDPIGKRIGWGTLERPMTVVGVAGDIRLFPASRPGPHVYMPFQQNQARAPHELVVRSEFATAALIDAVRRTVWAIDPAQPIAGISTLDALKERAMARRRFQLIVFSLAAVVAVALAVVGIYGVLSYAAGQMAAELGVRVALGASRGGLTWYVMRMGLAPVAVGVIAGSVLAWWSAGLLRTFLFQVDPRDPLAFGAAAALLTLTAAVACLVPAWRAALADPLITMRAR